MDSILLDILQADNPWLRDPRGVDESWARHLPAAPIQRRVPGIDEWPVEGHAHLVVGARQVGKSSLVWMWCRGRETPPLLVNAEEPAVRQWSTSAALAAEDLVALAPAGSPILIEEAQRLPDAGLFVKGLVDRRLPNPLFVTGSSSFHLLAKTRESLAGRAVRVLLHPFSLPELAATLRATTPAVHRAALRDLALRHAVVGGYPEAWRAANPFPVLAHLVESFVVKDASDVFRIQHVGAFRTLLRLLAGQAGSLVNLSEWASLCGVSRPTIASYIDLLCETHVAHLVPPFVGGKRSEVTGRPKIYLSDPGIRNRLLNAPQPFDCRADRGPLFETWVAAELAKSLDPLLPSGQLRFWRSSSGAEVDFVLETATGLSGVEVKAQPLCRPSLSRSARSFIDAYRPARLLVVNLGLIHEERIGDTQVRWVGPEVFVTGEL